MQASRLDRKNFVQAVIPRANLDYIASNTYWSHIYQDLPIKVNFCQVFVI